MREHALNVTDSQTAPALTMGTADAPAPRSAAAAALAELVERAVHAILTQREQCSADKKAGGHRVRAQANAPLATMIEERAEAQRRRNAFELFVDGLSLSEQTAVLVIHEYRYGQATGDLAARHANVIKRGADAIEHRFTVLDNDDSGRYALGNIAEDLLDGYARACEHGLDVMLGEAMIAADAAASVALEKN